MENEIKPVISDEVLMQENRNLQILQRSLAGALKEVFGEYTESQRFLDLKRIPLICKDISNINKNIEDIKAGITIKDSDHEIRLRSIETYMNTQTGKASQSSMYGAYIISVISIIIGIVMHFWK
jgi:hypothetical protein